MRKFSNDPDAIASTERDTAAANQTLDRLLDQSRRDSRSQKVLLGAAVVVILAFVTLIYLPSVRRLQSMHRKISDDAAMLEAESRQANRLPGVRSAADRLEQNLGMFKTLPSRLEQNQFFRDVNEISARLSLRDMQFEPQGVVELSAARRSIPVREFPVKLSFRGDFINVFNFLRQLEELPRLLRVRDVVVSRADADNSAAQLTPGTSPRGEVRVEMTISLFFGSATGSGIAAAG